MITDYDKRRLLKLAFHGADTDTDTDTDMDFLARILVRKSHVGLSDVRMYIDVSGESESVSVSVFVSASWNASLTRQSVGET